MVSLVRIDFLKNHMIKKAKIMNHDNNSSEKTQAKESIAKDKSRIPEEDNLIDETYSSLESKLLLAKQNIGHSKKFDDLIKKLEDLLSKEKNWLDANKIEVLIIPLLDPNQIDTGTNIKFGNLKKHLDPEEINYFKEQILKAQTSEEVRLKTSVFSEILNRLHWKHDKREIERIYAAIFRKRTNKVFICIVSLFLLFSVISVYLLNHTSDYKDKLLFDLGLDICITMVILTAGALGHIITHKFARR